MNDEKEDFYYDELRAKIELDIDYVPICHHCGYPIEDKYYYDFSDGMVCEYCLDEVMDEYKCEAPIGLLCCDCGDGLHDLDEAYLIDEEYFCRDCALDYIQRTKKRNI